MQSAIQGQKKPGLVGRVLELAKKIYYDSVFSFKIVLNAQHNPNAWILGKHYTSRQQIEKAIANIIWLTYREHISGPIVRTDVGWGCMIRVGQMLLAQTFRRHLKCEKSNTKDSLLHILSAFIDEDQGLHNVGNYSIQRITKCAVKQMQMEVGEWHSPASISYCLRSLHHANPLPGCQKVRIHVSQSSLFFDQVSKQMKSPQNSLLISVLCMLGLDSCQPQKMEGIKMLMQSRFFNGMIGGQPKRAYYFVGTTGKNFIYLDPHIVKQSSSRQQIQLEYSSFFCNYYTSLKSKNVHPSLSVCFYVEKLSQLYELFEEILDFKTQGYDIPFFFAKNPKELYTSMKNNIVREIIDDYDQIEQEEDQNILIEVNQSNIYGSGFFQELIYQSPQQQILANRPANLASSVFEVVPCYIDLDDDEPEWFNKKK